MGMGMGIEVPGRWAVFAGWIRMELSYFTSVTYNTYKVIGVSERNGSTRRESRLSGMREGH